MTDAETPEEALAETRNDVYRHAAKHLDAAAYREFCASVQKFEFAAGHVCRYCEHGQHHGLTVWLEGRIEHLEMLLSRCAQHTLSPSLERELEAALAVGDEYP